MLCGNAVCNLATHHQGTYSVVFQITGFFPSPSDHIKEYNEASQVAYLKNPHVIWEPLLPFRMRWRVIWL